MKQSFANNSFLQTCLIFLFILLLYSCDKEDTNKNKFSNNISTGEEVEVASETISSSGGTLEIDVPESEINGLKIIVPANSYTSSKSFKITTSSISNHNLGQYFNPISPLIQIGNGGGYADSIMEITIPIDIAEGVIPLGFFYDKITGKLEAIPVKSYSLKSITLLTRHFMSASDLLLNNLKSTYLEGNVTSNLIISSISESVLKMQAIISSGYKVGVDDWEFTNRGSYIAPGGHCAGQNMTAMWYYFEKKLKGEGNLFGKFSTVASIEEDNAIGYRFCSVIHKDLDWAGEVSNLFGKYIDKNQELDKQKYYLIAGAMLVTGEPQGIGIYRYIDANGDLIADRYPNGTLKYGGHDLICYQIAINQGKLYISDPNHPGVGQTIDFENNKFKPYQGKAHAQADTYSYPFVTWYAKTAYIEWNQIAKRYTELIDSTIGNKAPNTFPAYTIWVKGQVDQELTSGFSASNDTLRCYVECPTAEKFINVSGKKIITHLMTDKDGKIISTSETGEKKYTILKPGSNKIGFYISSQRESSFYMEGGVKKYFSRYIDFKWITVNYSALSIIANPENSQIGKDVIFTAKTNGTAPPSAKYLWDFGDGTAKETKTDSTITHVFRNNGKFTVKVELLDASNKKINESEKIYEIKEKSTSMNYSFSFTKSIVDSYGTVENIGYQISGKVEVFGNEEIISITQNSSTKAITVLLKEEKACNVSFTCSFSSYSNTSFDKWYYPGAGYKFKVVFKGITGMKCSSYSSSVDVDSQGKGNIIIDYGSRYFTFNGKYRRYEEWWYNDRLDQSQTREYEANATGFDFIIKK